MIKKRLCLIAALAAVLLCADIFFVSAAQIADSFSPLTDSDAKKYERLSPDPSGPVIAAGARSGSALYRVTGVEKIKVTIYSSRGTFCTRPEGGYIMGLSGAYSGSGAYRLMLNETRDRLFFSDGAQAYEIIYSDFTYKVSAAESAPAAYRHYGLSAYFYREGESRGSSHELILSGVRVQPSPQALYYEEYSANVPAGTDYILLELNDYESLPASGGGKVYNAGRGSLGFYGVVMQGESAAFWSAPPPELPEESEEPAGSKAAGGSTWYYYGFEYVERTSSAAPSKASASSKAFPSAKADKLAPNAAASSDAPESAVSPSSAEAFVSAGSVLPAPGEAISHDIADSQGSRDSRLPIVLITVLYMAGIAACIVIAALRTAKGRK